MNYPLTKLELPECCKAAGEAYFITRFPLQILAEDTLRDHLVKIAKKWGPITETTTQRVYFRTVSREFAKDEPRPYFNAEMKTLRCPQGHAFQFALLGRRIYYPASRIHVICLSFFREMDAEGASVGFSGPSDWPGPEQVEQLKIALRMYSQDAFLSNEGFEDLYKWAHQAPDKLVFHHMAISEMDLLFIFLHEIHHGMEEFYALNPDCPSAIQVTLDIEGLGRKQHDYWLRELQADGNAFYMLALSVSAQLCDKSSIPKEKALAIAYNMVAQAADLVLHALEYVERQKHGKIDAEKTISMPVFATHPPCDLRRSTLSYVCYERVTGKPHAMLFKEHSTPEWRQVQQNCGSQIEIRERLYAAAEASW